MIQQYREFLASKVPAVPLSGTALADSEVHPVLYPFQRAIVKWAVKRGRAAIFADCGLGKTLMQIEWARHLTPENGRCLIVAPLAVSTQTINEARKLDINVGFATEPIDSRFQITNYQKLHHFIGAPYDCIVLDESSILKSLDGKTRRMLIAEFTDIRYRLCCTATPAPNDIAELANHSEFLGVMPRVDMMASFFVHDSDGVAAGKWRLKGHAARDFWRWMAGWSVYLRKPSDAGFDDDGFILPRLSIEEDAVDSGWKPDGMLFATKLGGIQNRRSARKGTITERVNRAVDIIRSTPGQWLAWVGLNTEGDALQAALGDDCFQIAGTDSDEDKIEREILWRAGQRRVLISKVAIFGFGMNWQHCNQMLFLGLGDSYEQYYQAIRRCWRFGQERPVRAIILTSEAEREIVDNVKAKERAAEDTAAEVIGHTHDALMEELGIKAETREDDGPIRSVTTEDWTMMLGDCVERISEVPDRSVALSLFSPPFASLYTYSPSERDMGNSRDYEQFFQHFGFLAPELMRVTMPGRRCCVHVQQVTTTAITHGVIGWRDFRADVVRLFTGTGWVYDGEVVIDKDPQAQAIRTKSKALMFVQKARDSSWLRPAMADYILCFRHPGINTVPVLSDASNEEWIQWARPIWYGIRESDTLNAREAREHADERHICPLQLETIERCVRLWTNAGETVLSPFAGIGSEGYVAVKNERRFIGIELKESYWRQAVKNLQSSVKQPRLFTKEA